MVGKFSCFLLCFSYGMLFLSCQGNRTKGSLELFQIHDPHLRKAVLLIDKGCNSCKNYFYNYVLNDWPDSTALVIRRGISSETRLQYGEMLNMDFFYQDSLDRSFEIGLTEKNTEMALIKNGKISHYNFRQYEELIKELENN